jgi:hypothetical protein
MKTMKASLLKFPSMKLPRTAQTTMAVRHGLMTRRDANQNAHIITPHGKIQAGRKGRKG